MTQFGSSKRLCCWAGLTPVSYTHLDVYKRQILLGALSVIGLSAVSLVPLLVTGTAVGTAIAWRLLVTLGSKMVTTFVTDAFCLAVYVAILGGIHEHIATSIVALVIWLIIMDLGVNALQHAVVGIPKRN